MTQKELKLIRQECEKGTIPLHLIKRLVKSHGVLIEKLRETETQMLKNKAEITSQLALLSGVFDERINNLEEKLMKKEKQPLTTANKQLKRPKRTGCESCKGL